MLSRTLKFVLTDPNGQQDLALQAALSVEGENNRSVPIPGNNAPTVVNWSCVAARLKYLILSSAKALTVSLRDDQDAEIASIALAAGVPKVFANGVTGAMIEDDVDHLQVNNAAADAVTLEIRSGSDETP